MQALAPTASVLGNAKASARSPALPAPPSGAAVLGWAPPTQRALKPSCSTARAPAGATCFSRGARQRCAATPGEPVPYDPEQYVEAVIESVRHTDKYGHVIYLKLKDETGGVLPVYIGDFECSALVKEMNNRPTVRPLTHDLFRQTIELLGHTVSMVRVTELVGNTYHARVHFAAPGAAPEGAGGAVLDIDARPSDAINLAVRFGAPVFVAKDIAERMAHVVHEGEPGAAGSGSESSSGLEEDERSDIEKACRETILNYQDPTIMYNLALQLAIQEERFEDAIEIRNKLERLMSTDRALSIIVAMETALEDGRLEEAARLRETLHEMDSSRSYP